MDRAAYRTRIGVFPIYGLIVARVFSLSDTHTIHSYREDMKITVATWIKMFNPKELIKTLLINFMTIIIDELANQKYLFPRILSIEFIF